MVVVDGSERTLQKSGNVTKVTMAP